MTLSQKCQYALQALLELAKRGMTTTTRIGQIAAAQRIPARFLELILAELRQGGFVTSRRGRYGGYVLAVPPEELTVGQVIRFVDGPLWPVSAAGRRRGPSPFEHIWADARRAIAEVYDGASLQDVLEHERRARAKQGVDYVI